MYSESETGGQLVGGSRRWGFKVKIVQVANERKRVFELPTYEKW